MHFLLWKVFDYPVSYTDRPQGTGEINGLHHWFVPADKFTSMEKEAGGGFIFTYEEDSYRYGYKFFNLVRPNRERGKVALYVYSNSKLERTVKLHDLTFRKPFLLTFLFFKHIFYFFENNFLKNQRYSL